MKKIFLLLIVFFGGSTGAQAADAEIIPHIESYRSPGYYWLNFTFLQLIASSTQPNLCYQRNPCILGVAFTIGGQIRGGFDIANAYSKCYTDDCKTSTLTAKTMGELAPLVKYLGHNGTRTPRSLEYIGDMEIRLCFTAASPLVGTFACGPVIPTTTTCDILDTNATVDFGSFSSDVTARQASGNIRVNCSNEAYVRVKFVSNVTNMPLSQDGRLTASLKFRDEIAGTGGENYLRLPGGSREIFIDGELRNNNTSHTGPFSVPVVAIVELI
ncbi:fimbrial protein [Serratia ureilytica]|uniref:hypothetical protein n=1 Tax=Serratia ureilytica TaxID=300181 RepID=UPI001D18817E|nr:hypothetical protein [Serratia ureilytica]MCC4106636.1 hypothetical protein [Serratia ureilytica]